MDQIPAHYQQAASLIVENMDRYSDGWTVDVAFDYPIDQEPWLPQNIFGDTTPDRVAHAGAIAAYCEVVAGLVKMAAVTTRWPCYHFGLKQQLALSPIDFAVTANLSPRQEGIWLTVSFKQCFPTLQIVGSADGGLLVTSQVAANHTRPTNKVTSDEMLGHLEGCTPEERAMFAELPISNPLYVPYKN